MTFNKKRIFRLTFFAAIITLFLGLVLTPQGIFAYPNQQTNPITTVTITDSVILPNAKRLGINAGRYDQYGAGQILKNLIPNPGFEAGEFAMIFLAEQGATYNKVRAARWIGRWDGHNNGFWDNAHYEIISGNAKGRSGTVYRYALEGGRYTFYLTGGGKIPQGDDAILVRMPQVDGYFTDKPSQFVQADPTQKRPGSPGKQALRLSSSNFQPALAIGLDSFGRDADRSAGKLNIIEGNYQFEIWARSAEANQTLEIKFHRVQERIFYEETIPITNNWQKISRQFYVPPGADSPFLNNPLAFEVRIASGKGDVWVDDVVLQNSGHQNPTPFTDSYVYLMKQLQPGVLRYWGAQLGSSLDNQLASPWARKTNGFDPFNRNPEEFTYSLHEFLQLAQFLDSEPWYVIPPTFTAAEMQNLIAYLSAPAGSHPYAKLRADLGQPTPWTTIFPKIHLEFGNEMWGPADYGDPFVGATVRTGGRVGEIANSRFAVARRSPYFQPYKLNLIIGGQVGNPWQQEQAEIQSSNHDSIAFAPYFGDLTYYGGDEQWFYPLFANPTQQVSNLPSGRVRANANTLARAGAGTEMAVYEINSHFTYGYIPLSIRNDYLTSFGMGLALPLHMLTFQRDLGINTQTAYTALEYSVLMPGKYERAKLWGLLRDSEATQRKRPGWLGLELANRAIRGSMLRTYQGGNNPTWVQQPLNGIDHPVEVRYIQTFAYREGQNDYGIILFNLHLDESQQVQLNLPKSPQWSGKLYTLSSNNIRDDNETANRIFIRTEQRALGKVVTLELAPHSMVVLEFTGW